MCDFFDVHVPKQCREDDAEEVTEKERPNFCDWFEPGIIAVDAQRAGEAVKAKAGLAALFGEGDGPQAEIDEHKGAAEDLFK